MKARLLVGLLTVALGGLTSCSNILEENGVINNVAESGMGELRINLTTDATLNVSTKAAEEVTTDKSSVTIKGKAINFDPALLMITATEITDNPEQKVTYTEKFTEFPMKVKASNYSVSAIYDKMNNQTLAWNAPSFAGKTASIVPVSKTQPGTASISATLDNSIITINENEFNKFKTKVSIDRLFVFEGSAPTPEEINEPNFSLIKTENSNISLYTDQLLFVKKEATDVRIYIRYKINENTKTHIHPIITETGGKTTSGKDYNITYTLVEESGDLNLAITVNGYVMPENVTVEVDPYK